MALVSSLNFGFTYQCTNFFLMAFWPRMAEVRTSHGCPLNIKILPECHIIICQCSGDHRSRSAAGKLWLQRIPCNSPFWLLLSMDQHFLNGFLAKDGWSWRHSSPSSSSRHHIIMLPYHHLIIIPAYHHVAILWQP